VESFLIESGKKGDVPREGADTAMARLEEEPLALHGRGEMNGATVSRVGGLFDQVFRDEGVYKAGHGGRANLLSMGELTEGEWSREDNDGEGRQARPVEAAGGVGVAQFAQQMDGGGMKGLGGLFGIQFAGS